MCSRNYAITVWRGLCLLVFCAEEYKIECGLLSVLLSRTANMFAKAGKLAVDAVFGFKPEFVVCRTALGFTTWTASQYHHNLTGDYKGRPLDGWWIVMDSVIHGFIGSIVFSVPGVFAPLVAMSMYADKVMTDRKKKEKEARRGDSPWCD